MADKKGISLKKRQQITQANRNIFFIVAGASLIVGFCAVGSVFLFQKMTFRATAIGEAQSTVATLKKNKEATNTLEARVSGLLYDDALRSVSQGEDMNPLRAVADALPVVNNPSALGASLSRKLLSVPGVSIESITISTRSDSSVTGDPSLTSSAFSGTGMIDFSFRVNSTAAGIKRTFENIEASIRHIGISSLKISYSTTQTLELTARASAYYSMPIDTSLDEKVLTPKTNAKPSSSATSGGSK
jgi:hypothetical protein